VQAWLPHPCLTAHKTRLRIPGLAWKALVIGPCPTSPVKQDPCSYHCTQLLFPPAGLSNPPPVNGAMVESITEPFPGWEGLTPAFAPWGLTKHRPHLLSIPAYPTLPLGACSLRGILSCWLGWSVLCPGKTQSSGRMLGDPGSLSWVGFNPSSDQTWVWSQALRTKWGQGLWGVPGGKA
jgi:hypothetical protein